LPPPVEQGLHGLALAGAEALEAQAVEAGFEVEGGTGGHDRGEH
jgi:hypothetical protein